MSVFRAVRALGSEKVNPTAGVPPVDLRVPDGLVTATFGVG